MDALGRGLHEHQQIGEATGSDMRLQLGLSRPVLLKTKCIGISCFPVNASLDKSSVNVRRLSGGAKCFDRVKRTSRTSDYSQTDLVQVFLRRNSGANQSCSVEEYCRRCKLWSYRLFASPRSVSQCIPNSDLSEGLPHRREVSYRLITCFKALASSRSNAEIKGKRTIGLT